METQAASSGYSALQLAIFAVVTLLASNTFTVLVTRWLYRKKEPFEISEISGRAELARGQATETAFKTLGTVSGQLRAAIAALEQAALERDILEAQVETARRRGYLDREEVGGTGPNPAA